MQPVATQGTDRNVKTISLLTIPGVGIQILPAQAGVVYRVVAAQASLDAAGSFDIYHGAAPGTTKTIAKGYAAANGGANFVPGDWACQAGQANEKVSADIIGGNGIVVLNYIEIKVLG